MYYIETFPGQLQPGRKCLRTDRRMLRWMSMIPSLDAEKSILESTRESPSKHGFACSCAESAADASQHGCAQHIRSRKTLAVPLLVPHLSWPPFSVRLLDLRSGPVRATKLYSRKQVQQVAGSGLERSIRSRVQVTPEQLSLSSDWLPKSFPFSLVQFEFVSSFALHLRS